MHCAGKRIKAWLGNICVAAWLFLLERAAFAQCAMCKTGLDADGDPTKPTQAAAGFFWSIVVMLSMPFALVAGLTVYLVAAHFKKRRLDISGV